MAVFDTLRVSLRLWRVLRRVARPDLVLMQNPPAFPTLAVSWSVLRRRNVRFVVDWHNLGFTVLRQRLGRWNPVVRLARWYERRDARRVDANICVSRAMAAWLESRFDIARPTVLYDRPASVFAPIERVERERFRQALLQRLDFRVVEKRPQLSRALGPQAWHGLPLRLRAGGQFLPAALQVGVAAGRQAEGFQPAGEGLPPGFGRRLPEAPGIALSEAR